MTRVRSLLIVLLILAAIPCAFVVLAGLVVGLGLGGFAAFPITLVALPFLAVWQARRRRRRR